MFSQIIYQSLGAGWTFVLLSGICVAGLPLVFIVIRYGKKWREWRALKATQGSKLFQDEKRQIEEERAQVLAEKGNESPSREDGGV